MPSSPQPPLRTNTCHPQGTPQRRTRRCSGYLRREGQPAAGRRGEQESAGADACERASNSARFRAGPEGWSTRAKAANSAYAPLRMGQQLRKRSHRLERVVGQSACAEVEGTINVSGVWCWREQEPGTEPCWVYRKGGTRVSPLVRVPCSFSSLGIVH